MAETTCPECESSKRNERSFIEDKYNPGTVGRCHNEWHAEIVTFEAAQVGDHAYTWEIPNSHFGEYRFETADNPRSLYDEPSPLVRKLWLLVEVTPIEGVDDAVSDEIQRTVAANSPHVAGQ